MAAIHPITTVLEFMDAAQVVLAIYGSPDGPTDPLRCYDTLLKLLEDPALLAAQLALKAGGHAFVMILGEPKETSFVSGVAQQGL